MSKFQVATAADSAESITLDNFQANLTNKSTKIDLPANHIACLVPLRDPEQCRVTDATKGNRMISATSGFLGAQVLTSPEYRIYAKVQILAKPSLS